MSRLWDKGDDVDELVLRYTVGDDPLLDDRLVAYDVRASIAHVTMLDEQGHLPPGDAEKLQSTLEAIGREHEQGDWKVAMEEEDCHTAIENRLSRRLGQTGGRIHLGRSRNDQVLAALRLYLLAETDTLAGQLEATAEALRTLSREQGEIPLPGYTHMQRAMPSSVELWATAFASELHDDADGLRGARRRLSKNPLGSAAGYGVPVVQIDRQRTAELLEFDSVHSPVTAVQLSRGKAEAQIAFELALTMQDLGRLASDLCVFATSEYGFVRLPTELTTGSSIMPQKRNPDVFELVRGRSAQSVAELHAILAVTGKMTSGYHRDLQLIKAPLFRALDTAKDTIEIVARAVPQVEFRRDATERAIDPTLFATEHAYRIVATEGVPFREAYGRVGRELPHK